MNYNYKKSNTVRQPRINPEIQVNAKLIILQVFPRPRFRGGTWQLMTILCSRAQSLLAESCRLRSQFRKEKLLNSI